MASVSRDGILLVGHGTRDERGADEFRAAARLIAATMGERLVEPCFLELRQPNLAAGLERLIQRGASRVAVVPLLLLAAGHARRDIPAILAELAPAHGDIELRLCPHVGSHRAVVELSKLRYDEALAEPSTLPPQQTLLLLVARGTSDAEAIEEMRDFARRRASAAPAGRVEVCFAAVAEPTLDTALAQAANLPYSRIVVQPHLLFAGLVLDGIRASVERVAEQQPGREWLLTRPLGVSSLLGQAVGEIVERVRSSGERRNRNPRTGICPCETPV